MIRKVNLLNRFLNAIANGREINFQPQTLEYITKEECIRQLSFEDLANSLKQLVQEKPWKPYEQPSGEYLLNTGEKEAELCLKEILGGSQAEETIE